MGLLEDLGVLSKAQDFTDGAADSTNVIALGAIPDVGFNDMWLDIETETKIGGSAGTSSTYSFALVVATAANLTTFKTVLTVDILNDVADPRIAAVNRKIASCEVGMMISELADATYAFLGLIVTLADGNGTATVSINAAMSPSKPRTRDDVQVTRSNISLPS